MRAAPPLARRPARALHGSVAQLEFGPEDLPVRLALTTGDAILRPLAPGDAGRLIAFFATHTPETIHQRYGYSLGEMTPEHARQLVEIDRSRDVALGIFEESHGEPALIAIGRYCRGKDGRSAEVAFVVHEDRRCQGLAGLLLRTLRKFAQAHGVERLIAYVQHDNAPMLAVFRHVDASICRLDETLELQVTLPVQPPARMVPQSDKPGRNARAPLAWLRRANRQVCARLQTAASKLPTNIPLP